MTRDGILKGFAAALFLAAAVQTSAQERGLNVYTIGVGDILRVSVWQEPSLDREVEVGIDSTIVLPLVGPIRAAGYTPAQLSRILTERYSLYKRDISQVEVVVVEYNSREIFVFGEVAHPGPFAFQEIPDLWSVIMKAGGPTGMAYLREVRILRGDGEGRRSIPVDLNAFLLGAVETALPRLQPGDTVYIPRTNVEGPDAFSTNKVYVYGEVRTPGMFLVGPGEDLIGAILLAGGVTEFADVEHVRLVRADGERRVVQEVNLDDYLRRGDLRANPALRPGDTVEVGLRSSNRFRRFFEDVRPTLSTLTSLVTVYLLVDRISNN
ncbi:MAG: polysaccharide biosynthesis/export family protein [Candidatus Eisenbacteria bacterium]|nr:polysaccharide biosynthesis/export family protein [Candidatus Eisenbacteria bacterium]